MLAVSLWLTLKLRPDAIYLRDELKGSVSSRRITRGQEHWMSECTPDLTVT